MKWDKAGPEVLLPAGAYACWTGHHGPFCATVFVSLDECRTVLSFVGMPFSDSSDLRSLAGSIPESRADMVASAITKATNSLERCAQACREAFG